MNKQGVWEVDLVGPKVATSVCVVAYLVSLWVPQVTLEPVGRLFNNLNSFSPSLF